MIPKLQIILRAVLVLITLTLSTRCKGEPGYEFELNGEMNIIPHRYNIPQYSCKMRVCFRDYQWAIFKTWETSTNRIVQEMSDDGTNIYWLSHNETLENNWVWKTITNSWVGQINRSGFPRYTLQTEEVILFYAYASDRYLSSVSNGLIDPIKFEPNDLFKGDERVNSAITYGSGSVRLPQQIAFISLRQSRTNAVFNSSNITNIGKLEIPLALSLTRFDSSDGTPLVDYDFKVHGNVEGCKLESFTPFLPQTAFVSDYRFSRGQAYVPPIVESASNGWMAEITAKRQPGYEATKLDWVMMQKQRFESSFAKPARLFIVRLIFASTFVGCIGLTAYYMRVRRRNIKMP